MGSPKGRPKYGGRQKGTPNKKTAMGFHAEQYWKGIVVGASGDKPLEPDRMMPKQLHNTVVQLKIST